jgi:broad specificity phosphatase PhoE
MILVLRHSEKQNQSNNINEKNSWKTSRRFKINQLDVPLSKNGFDLAYKSIKKILHNYKGNFGYIYSSPLTRCIQTSIEFQKYIKDTYDVKILIRIENGLISNFFGEADTLYFGFDENALSNPVVKFVNDKPIITKPMTYIDDYLSSENIFKRYGKSKFDVSYEPHRSTEDINNEYEDLPSDICRSRINTFKKIVDISKNEINLIVTHGEILNLLNSWITNKWNPNNEFQLCGGFEVKITKSKKVKINKKIE